MFSTTHTHDTQLGWNICC